MTFTLGSTTTLAARRALSSHAGGLQTSLQRLSSGLRVNSARDDAAGLGLAERLTSRLRGARQAARNANDAISLFQTADGALAGMAERLQRTRELVVQALSEATSESDRRAIDGEVRQQLAELDRTAASTRFNGRALLDGSIGSSCWQVGAASADTLEIAFDTSVRAADLGAIARARSTDLRTIGNRAGGFVFAATYTTVPVSQLDFSQPELRFSGGSARTNTTPPTDYGGGNTATFTVDGATVTLNADYGGLGGVANAVQSQLSGYVVTHDGSRITITKTTGAPQPTAAPQIAAVSGAGANVFAAASGSAGTAAQRTTNAGFTVDGRRVALTADHSGDFDGLLADIQRQLDAGARGAYTVSGSNGGISIRRNSGVDPPVVGGFTGIGASVFASAPVTGLTLGAGELYLQLGDGPRIAVTGTFVTPQALADGIRRQVPGCVTSIDEATGRLEIDAGRRITLSGTAAEASGSLAFESLVVEPDGSLDDVDATEAAEGRRSVLRIDVALDTLMAQRATFGALQTRFEAVIDTLQVEASQAAAARGRIVDADLAAETAELARRQVLQRSATALLAQANARRADVLALLR
jgi:flagellin